MPNLSKPLTGETQASADIDGAVEAPSLSKGLSAGKLALIGVKIAISAGVLWFLISRHAPSLAQFRAVDVGWAAAAIVLLLAQPVLAAERWRGILIRLGHAPPFATVFKVFYSSQFFSQVLPAGGDVARVLLHSSVGMRATTVAFSVLADRVVGMISLFAITLIVLLTGVVPPSIATPLGFLTGGGLLAVATYILIEPTLQKSGFWSRLPAPLRTLSDVAVWSVRSKFSYTRLQPISLLIYALSLGALFFVALAAGIPNAGLAVLSAGPIMLLAQALPISIGGWGVREMAAVLLMNTAGVAGPPAMLVSILFGICVLAAALPGLAIWLLMKL